MTTETKCNTQKLYFNADLSNADFCYRISYWQEYLRENNLTEIKLSEAKVQYGKEYFFCKFYGEVGIKNGSCGITCKGYKPRNGKYGWCSHSGFCYEATDKIVTLYRKPISTVIVGGISQKLYLSIHNWIRRKYGNANKCEFCGSLYAKRYDWALKKGCKYEKLVENFIQLCKKCHSKYDYSPDTKHKISKSHKGIPCKHLHKPLIQYDMHGNFIKEFNHAYEAALELNIARTGITNCMNGRSKSCAGFIWKYKK